MAGVSIARHLGDIGGNSDRGTAGVHSAHSTLHHTRVRGEHQTSLPDVLDKLLLHLSRDVAHVQVTAPVRRGRAGRLVSDKHGLCRECAAIGNHGWRHGSNSHWGTSRIGRVNETKHALGAVARYAAVVSDDIGCVDLEVNYHGGSDLGF